MFEMMICVEFILFNSFNLFSYLNNYYAYIVCYILCDKCCHIACLRPGIITRFPCWAGEKVMFSRDPNKHAETPTQKYTLPCVNVYKFI